MILHHNKKYLLRVEYDKEGIEDGMASRGRNGYFKAGGYDVYHMIGCEEVLVRALTSKGQRTDALILRTPNDAWVGTALEKLLDALQADKKLPAYMNLHPLLDEMIAHRLHTSE
jgi:hypothetical protein